ncbi:hypothetical protein EZS27_019395 [termite gut metagenome]|uniref:Uncharacterized protein n=1 Tax=termite gut metagenome TaxID=433724 RepID=A0A5J4RFD2_9ZZZZ
MKANLLNKANILKALDCLPEQFTTEKLEYECYVLSCINEGLKDVEERNLIPHEEIEKLILSGEL